jgi:tyrosine ammonia-lyase
MGTIAARKASWQLDLAWQVLAIHAVALAQAAELRAGGGGVAGAEALAAAGFAPASRALWSAVRATVAPLAEDRRCRTTSSAWPTRSSATTRSSARGAGLA